jgi:hypothetical protein
MKENTITDVEMSMVANTAQQQISENGLPHKKHSSFLVTVTLLSPSLNVLSNSATPPCHTSKTVLLAPINNIPELP